MSSRYPWMLFVLALSLTTGCMTTHTIKPMHQMEPGEVAVAGQVQGLVPSLGASATVGIAEVMDFSLSGSGLPARHYVVGGGPRFYLGERLLVDLEFDLHYTVHGEALWESRDHPDQHYSDLDWLVTKQTLTYTFPSEGWSGFVGLDLDQNSYVPLKDDYADFQFSDYGLERRDKVQFQGARVGLLAGLEAEVVGGLFVLAQAGFMVPVYERNWGAVDSPYVSILTPHGEVGLYYVF